MCTAIQLQHLVIVSADDKQCRGTHRAHDGAGEVGPAAARHHRTDVYNGVGRDLGDLYAAELAEVLRCAHSGSRTERGFSINLDGAVEGRYPGIKLIVARDRRGRVQGFHRYTTAGHGSDVTLDVPFRRPGAPNGIDERLSIDMIADAKALGAQRLSLAFAAFPKVFDNEKRGPLHRVFYRLIHLLDQVIRLDSLYRYLWNFTHSASGVTRYSRCITSRPP